MQRIVRRLFSLAPATVQQWVRQQRQRRAHRELTRQNVAAVRGGERLVPERELEAKYLEALRLLRERGSELGDYLEFGVFNGSSLACMHRALAAVRGDGMRLFGFDSFEGLPAEAAHDDAGAWRPGQFSMDYEFTRRFLTEQGVDWGRVHLVKGWFNETLTPALLETHRIRKASVIMVDCDMYSSAKTALSFCAPLIGDVAVMFFDDWNTKRLAAKNLGEKRAFDEFLAEHPHFSVEEFGSYNENSHVVVVSRNGVSQRDGR